MSDTQELTRVFGIGIDKTDNVRKIENVDVVHIFSEIEKAKLYALSLCYNIQLPIIVFSFPVNTNNPNTNDSKRKMVCRYTNDVRKNIISDMGIKITS